MNTEINLYDMWDSTKSFSNYDGEVAFLFQSNCLDVNEYYVGSIHTKTIFDFGIRRQFTIMYSHINNTGPSGKIDPETCETMTISSYDELIDFISAAWKRIE